jgi:hypothetical protein
VLDPRWKLPPWRRKHSRLTATPSAPKVGDDRRRDRTTPSLVCAHRQQ